MTAMAPQKIVQNPELDRLLSETLGDSAILAVVLFGSSARGEFRRDIDICLIDYPGKVTPGKELHYRTKFAEPLDVHVFSKLPLYIKSRVINDGKILQNKNYEDLFDLYWKTIKEYELFRPHYELFLEMS